MALPGPVLRTPAAQNDLVEIWLHIARDNPNAADAVLDRIAILERFPEAGVARDDIVSGMRMLAIESYVVLYRIAGKGTEIVRIVHGARDATTLF